MRQAARRGPRAEAAPSAAHVEPQPLTRSEPPSAGPSRDLRVRPPPVRPSARGPATRKADSGTRLAGPGIAPNAPVRSSQSSPGLSAGGRLIPAATAVRSAAAGPDRRCADCRGRGAPSHRLGRIHPYARPCSAAGADRERSDWRAWMRGQKNLFDQLVINWVRNVTTSLCSVERG